MNTLRRTPTLRVVAAALLLSVVSATIAPSATAGTGATSRLYAEWLRERIPGTPAQAVEAVLIEASTTSVASLDIFVRDVVRTLVREEGLAWTSQALTGASLGSQADILSDLLEGLQSLGSGSLPAGSLSARQEAPRVIAQRTDLILADWTMTRFIDARRSPVASFEVRAVDAGPEPGRGNEQPLGP